jgi:hypothetical protein
MRSDALIVTTLAVVLATAEPSFALTVAASSEVSTPPFAAFVAGLGEMTIEHMTVPQIVPPATDEYRTYVRVSGDLPSVDVLTNVAHWHLTARTKDRGPVAIPLSSAIWSTTTRRLTLTFRRPGLGDPTSYQWKVLFTGNDLNLVGAPAAGGGAARLEAAKGKDDADLYAAGMWLAGRASAPLVAIDAKYGWAEEVGTTPWDVGFLAQASVNTDAELPAETSTFDLDAMSAAFALRYFLPNSRLGLVLDMQPVRGEFTKSLNAADVVGVARVTAFLPPFGTAAIRPYVGVELGVPFNKPDSLFGQAVDLSGWKSAERLVGGLHAVFYVFQQEITPDDLHRFSVDLSLTARKPLSDEPFVTAENIAGKSTAVVRLNRKVRQEIEGAVIWNINPFLGVQAQYKYGSLPPVFKLADHQVSVGLTFKAKRAGARPALF